MSTTTMISNNNLLSLNYDVLSLILAHLPPTDASHLALASRDAYSLAMPRFLSSITLGGFFHKPASFQPTHQLAQFASFMLALPTRPIALHRLEIMRDAVRARDPAQGNAWTTSKRAVALLADVLAHCTHLQELTLWGAAALFAAYPPIVDVLATLPALSTITLGGELPALAVLARAFPQARKLKLIEGGGTCGPDWDLPLPADTQFAHLDAIDAGSSILPLAQHVRRVALRNALSADSEAGVCALGNALAFVKQTQPVVLSCVLDRSVDAETFAQKLVEVGGDVKYLRVTLDREDVLEEVVEWMVSASLHFFLSISTY